MVVIVTSRVHSLHDFIHARMLNPGVQPRAGNP